MLLSISLDMKRQKRLVMDRLVEKCTAGNSKPTEADRVNAVLESGSTSPSFRIDVQSLLDS